MRDDTLSIERGADALDRLVARLSGYDGGASATGAKSAGAEIAEAKCVTRRVSDIEAKPVSWLWQGRIARGKVTLIAGHPGLGKSQLTTAIASVVTTGGQWPVDKSICPVGRVIILNAEDDVADTIKPRLLAAGARVELCEVLDAVIAGYAADGKTVTRSFNIRQDIEALDELLTARGDVALLIIDPVTAYLGSVDSHVNADVRAILAPLSELAAKHNVAIIAVSHLNKGSANKGAAGEAMLRVSGSLAFVAAARAAYLVVCDQENKERRLLLPIKNNIGPDQTGLAFTIASCDLGAGIETSQVRWENAPVLTSADEAMTAMTALIKDERSATEEAIEFLRDVLTGGPVDSRDVKRMATDAGITQKALRAARERLKVATERKGYGSKCKTTWRLPVVPYLSVVPISAHMKYRAPVGSEGTTEGPNPAADPPVEEF